jgi:hypothetical protein
LAKAVIPDTVNAFAVTFAVNVGWLRLYFAASAPEIVSPLKVRVSPFATAFESKLAA